MRRHRDRRDARARTTSRSKNRHQTPASEGLGPEPGDCGSSTYAGRGLGLGPSCQIIRAPAREGNGTTINVDSIPGPYGATSMEA